MGIETARHSLSHIMASVVVDMFPDAKLGIGPAIENGFYYDFDLPRTLVPEGLAPVQVKLLPISDRHHEYVRSVAGQLRSADIRVEVNDRSESIGKKIRKAELQKIPYMLVIGDKEAESQNVSVRTYQDGDVGQLTVPELVQRLKGKT